MQHGASQSIEDKEATAILWSIGRKSGYRFFDNPIRLNKEMDHRAAQINRPMIQRYRPSRPTVQA
ncbi:hypothetical protein AZF01_05245 [Martelella sp. AD-3]|nr:hypothetical protein AZF01_05245 [Martelella sp. AD-3]